MPASSVVPGANGFGRRSTAADVTAGLDLGGRTILVTGCSSGLGLETMRVLCDRGARVLGAARTMEKAAAVCAELPLASPLACDLSSPSSVRAAVAAVQRMNVTLDAIIANAGVMAPARLQQVLGYELQFFTNHVGHHHLVTRLLDRLSSTGRVVMLTSSAHRRAPPQGIQFENLSGERGYSPWTAYGQSKLANLLFAKQLASRFREPGQTANAVHPGVIRTNLQRHLGAALRAVCVAVDPVFFKTIAEGAATQCYAAVHPTAATLRGEYLVDCKVARPSKRAQDAVLAAKLWDVTEHILAQMG
jgi:NAD(P)-dependent dehydrogenase (short-subunit alcohol dehydrogenase family)